MERIRERNHNRENERETDMKRMNYEVAAFRAIAAPNMKKRDVAVLYMVLLLDEPERDMELVNKAIRARWGIAGLLIIQEIVDCEVELMRSRDPRVFLH